MYMLYMILSTLLHFMFAQALQKRVSPLAPNKHLFHTARHRETPRRVVKLPFQKLAP